MAADRDTDFAFAAVSLLALVGVSVAAFPVAAFLIADLAAVALVAVAFGASGASLPADLVAAGLRLFVELEAVCWADALVVVFFLPESAAVSVANEVDFSLLVTGLAAIRIFLREYRVAR